MITLSVTWNYRIIRSEHTSAAAAKPWVTYALHEVYYDSDGVMRSWTQEPATPLGETIAELEDDLNHMSKALALPVLVVTQDADGKDMLTEWNPA